VGTVTNPPPRWWHESNPQGVSIGVRVRGTTLALVVWSNDYNKGDVYAQFGAPFTGSVILEDTINNKLANVDVTNATSVLFSGAAKRYGT
jgi:hypothetical protein